MPPPSAYYQPNKYSAAKPTRNIFDPWNTSASGHQTAPNRLSGSTSWAESRTRKLGDQFGDGQRGGQRTSDTVGAGSANFGKNGRLENGAWEKGASGLRERGQQSIFDCMNQKKPGTSRNQEDAPVEEEARPLSSDEPATNSSQSHKKKQIFSSLNFYLNGSTYPLISDHKLKHLIAEHGGRLSIGLGRRTVTHVILGNPSRQTSGKGAGGGLANGKIQKEVTNVRGKGVKFVGVQWILDSIKAGKRLPETPYVNLRLAMHGQKSVYEMQETREDMPAEEKKYSFASDGHNKTQEHD